MHLALLNQIHLRCLVHAAVQTLVSDATLWQLHSVERLYG